MSERQDRFQQAMNQGHSAAWDQMWDRAENYYRQALEELPDHPQALANLGLALYEQQEYEQALVWYQRAARAAPGDPLPVEKAALLFERLGKLNQASQAYLHAAEGYLKNRDVNKAIENWYRVTRLNPESLPAHARLALVFEKMGEKQKAVAEYLAVASLLQSAGEKEKAVRAVNQALQISPNSDEAVQALAALRDQRPLPRPTRPRGGTAPLRMAQVRKMEEPSTDQADSRLDPIAQTVQRALMRLAGMLFEGQDEDGREHAPRPGLSSVLRGSGPLVRPVDRSRIVLHLGQLVDLQTNEQYSQAAEELGRAMEAGLEDPAAHFNLGFLRTQTGQFDEALSSLQQAAKHPDLALGSRLLIGELLHKKGQLPEASIEYLEALKLADTKVVDEAQADDLRQLYDPIIEAHRHGSEAADQERVCENIRALLVRTDWQAQIRRARQQLPAQAAGSPPTPLAEMITQAHSGKIVETISHIYSLVEQGKVRSAMEEAFYALQHAPTYLPLHTYMGELLVREKRLQEAAGKFAVVARAYSVRGETHRAIEMYRRILELAPTDMQARSNLIQHWLDLGQVEHALGEYIDMAGMYYNLADLDTSRKTYTEALRVAQQANVDRSWRVRLLHHMADIDLQSLDWRQALRIYEQIRTLQPDDEKARNQLVEINFRLAQNAQAISELDHYLAYLYSTNQVEKALAYLGALVEENPQRSTVRFRLAEALRKCGQTQAAIREFDTVGEALLEDGDRAGAIQAVEAIIAMNPPNNSDYLRLLGQLKFE